jgi:hypothetical protein
VRRCNRTNEVDLGTLAERGEGLLGHADIDDALLLGHSVLPNPVMDTFDAVPRADELRSVGWTFVDRFIWTAMGCSFRVTCGRDVVCQRSEFTVHPSIETANLSPALSGFRVRQCPFLTTRSA